MDDERDFSISDHGSVVMVYPNTLAAKDWVSENLALEGWQLFAGGFAVEPRYAGDLVGGIQLDGLSIA